MVILEGVRLKAFPKNTKGGNISDLKLCKNYPDRFSVPVNNEVQHLFAFEMSFIWRKYQHGIITKARDKKVLLHYFGHLTENAVLFSNEYCPRMHQLTFQSLSFPLGN